MHYKGTCTAASFGARLFVFDLLLICFKARLENNLKLLSLKWWCCVLLNFRLSAWFS